MKKLSIKQKKENVQKKALLQRITDVYSGALGSNWDDEEFATAAILEKVVHALEKIFGPQNDWGFMWANHCLSHFDTPNTAMEFLYEHGIKA